MGQFIDILEFYHFPAVLIYFEKAKSTSILFPLLERHLALRGELVVQMRSSAKLDGVREPGSLPVEDAVGLMKCGVLQIIHNGAGS